MSKKRPIPTFKTPLIETHCHLDYLKDHKITDVLEQSQSLGIEKLITIAVSPNNLDAVLDIAKEYDNVWTTQGVHPHEAKDFSSSVETKIRQNAIHSKVVSIGEIGLDYHYNNSPKKDQISAFENQIKIAIDLDLPIVIHTREADEDTQTLLKEYASDLKRKGVIHSFTSGRTLAEFCLDQGFYLGFNGICTFKNAHNVREIISITPVNQLLLETDSPFLTPVPYRGRENAPVYLPFVAEKVAEVKTLMVDDLLKQVYQNSNNLFFSPSL